MKKQSLLIAFLNFYCIICFALESYLPQPKMLSRTGHLFVILYWTDFIR